MSATGFINFSNISNSFLIVGFGLQWGLRNSLEVPERSGA
jgi:hypothetical protein